MSSYYHVGNQARKKLRLSHYDYRNTGYYFVTVCTEGRLCLFGKIVNGNMLLNDAGKMVHSIWCAIPRQFSSIQIDTIIVMPDQVHGIVIINTQRSGPAQRPALSDNLRKWDNDNFL